MSQANSPSPRGAAPAPTALSVDGNVDATSFTGDGTSLTGIATSAALCLTIDYRYVDLGDGTILDCNTGKMWLKAASCLGTGTWDDTGTSVFTLVADLNDTEEGSDFGCTDYTEGTYTDWEVPAMTDLCGMWNGSCAATSCCTASEGIVDTSVGTDPTVGNAVGDGQWSAEDAFVGVQSGAYWSATEDDATNAWLVDLFNGFVGLICKDAFFYVWPVRSGQ